MNKVLLILMGVLLAFTTSFAQEAWIWGADENGEEIVWGTGFWNTDSLYLREYLETTTIDTSDTVYTNMILIPGDENVGTAVITFSGDSVDAASDSIKLDLRFYYDKNIHPNHFWGVWNNIGGYLAGDQLHVFQIADSSWWGPASGLQYRSYRVDTAKDTLTPNLGQYSN